MTVAKATIVTGEPPFMSELDEFFRSQGYRRSIAGTYRKDYEGDWTGYVALNASGLSTLHSVGVINQHVNKIMYRILSSLNVISTLNIGVPPIRATRMGPALCMVSGRIIEGQLWRSRSFSDSEEPRSAQRPQSMDLEQIATVLSQSIQPFIQSNLHLRAAIDTAYAYNKFMQAQRYCLPIALLRIGADDECWRYTNEWLDLCRHPEERALYCAYVDQLRVQGGTRK